MPVPREEYLSSIWKDGIFDNKVLFCTGGAGTICSMQVRAFVALGGNACIIGRNVEKTEKGAEDIATVRPGSKVIGIGNVDVRDPAALKAAADRCAKELGGIDFAIAGAAGNFLAPINQLSSNAFKTVMDIDALGSFITAKACLPYLVESAKKHTNTGKQYPNGTGGRMIFISASFHFVGKPMQAHVMAAKAAVDQISNSIAIEYGPYGITSNVITPGPISGTEGMERLGRSDPESVKASKKGIPLGRWGEVKEIADATVFLFSEAASYQNGTVMVVDGGQWRTSGASDGRGAWQYPDFLMSGESVTGVKIQQTCATLSELEKVLKNATEAAPYSTAPGCTSCELFLESTALIPLHRPVIGPYSEGGEHDIPSKFKTRWADAEEDQQYAFKGGERKQQPIATVQEIVDISDSVSQASVQRAASRGIQAAIEAADWFRYSFNNSWSAKNENGLRFSYICQDSLQNKDRHANGAARNQIVPLSERVEVRKQTWDCKGSISVKCCPEKTRIEVSYKHFAVHPTYAERKPAPRRSGARMHMGCAEGGVVQRMGGGGGDRQENGLAGALLDTQAAYGEASAGLPPNVGKKRKRMTFGANYGKPLINDDLSLAELLKRSEDAKVPPKQSTPKQNASLDPAGNGGGVQYDLPSWEKPPLEPLQRPLQRPVQTPQTNDKRPLPYQLPYTPTQQHQQQHHPPWHSYQPAQANPPTHPPSDPTPSPAFVPQAFSTERTAPPSILTARLASEQHTSPFPEPTFLTLKPARVLTGPNDFRTDSSWPGQGGWPKESSRVMESPAPAQQQAQAYPQMQALVEKEPSPDPWFLSR
ncbi:peroxisomal 2 4-dienoyl-CoA reductase sps19 [Saxophila tyrrhenica]|uniref:2,4-dienoyl-CoA reductase [(3E)-enoyl-CoA-producing] n=1 Tax=Saxophila tyrrhenica TaxID=1690608 RepID=A0AAV9PR63_9PEZI|nr:peroxisomal 2 4-dienoyl-CoA reductase sps19 [Saxophila tyrrhenica]